MKYFFIELLAKYSNIGAVISGAAQPQITIDGLSTVKALLPPQSYIDKFQALVGNIPELVDSLERKTTNLRMTRDLLLPKLVSGELDVSELNI